jgi:hypothetical protein
MSARAKTVLWTIRLAGLMSLALLILVKTRSLAPWFGRICPQEDWIKYGDLYGQTLVPEFKILIPPEQGPPLSRNPSTDAATLRVYVMGDSFMPFRRGHPNYVASLAERLGQPVGFEGWDIPSAKCLYTRLHSPVDKSVRRLVVIERVERILTEQFADIKECPAWMVEEHRATRSVGAFLARASDFIFEDSEAAFRVFFSFSRMTLPLAEAFFTLRFRLTGQLEGRSVVYSLNPPFAFFERETNPALPTSFYYPHDDAIVERIADNIARMRTEVKEVANADLVFMPIPNKYTLYHTVANNDPYDDFLPRVCDAVAKRGVPVVRLYEKFKAEKRLTFYPTDTHWSPVGIDIALDETMAVLRGLKWR